MILRSHRESGAAAKSFRRILKQLAQVGLLALCILIAIISFNVWRLDSRQIDVAAVRILELPEKIMTERLAGAIQFDETLATGQHRNDKRSNR